MNRQEYVNQALKRGYSRSQLQGLNSHQLYALIMNSSSGTARVRPGISNLTESERSALMQYLKK